MTPAAERLRRALAMHNQVQVGLNQLAVVKLQLDLVAGELRREIQKAMEVVVLEEHLERPSPPPRPPAADDTGVLG